MEEQYLRAQSSCPVLSRQMQRGKSFSTTCIAYHRFTGGRPIPWHNRSHFQPSSLQQASQHSKFYFVCDQSILQYTPLCHHIARRLAHYRFLGYHKSIIRKLVSLQISCCAPEARPHALLLVRTVATVVTAGPRTLARIFIVYPSTSSRVRVIGQFRYRLTGPLADSVSPRSDFRVRHLVRTPQCPVVCRSSAPKNLLLESFHT